VQTKISDAIREIEVLFKGGRAKVRVALVNELPSLSCYQFDSAAIVALPKYERGRGGVLTLQFGRGGFLWAFLDRQVAALEKGAKTVVSINCA